MEKEESIGTGIDGRDGRGASGSESRGKSFLMRFRGQRERVRISPDMKYVTTKSMIVGHMRLSIARLLSNYNLQLFP